MSKNNTENKCHRAFAAGRKNGTIFLGIANDGVGVRGSARGAADAFWARHGIEPEIIYELVPRTVRIDTAQRGFRYRVGRKLPVAGKRE